MEYGSEFSGPGGHIGDEWVVGEEDFPLGNSISGRSLNTLSSLLFTRGPL